MKKSLLTLFAFIAVNSYAQVDVTSTGGLPTATYLTVKDAFDAVNAGTHQGDVILSITANTTETATAVLNASATYSSLYIQPSSGTMATVSGNIANGAVLRILGSNVFIDGSNNGTTTRDLTFTNTSVTAPQVIAMGSPSAVAPMTNVSIKNTNFINGINTSSAVVVADGNGLAGYFKNITLKNNTVQKAYIGIYFLGAISAGNGSGVVVTENDLSVVGANAIRLAGIYLQGIDGGTVSNNLIGNFDTAMPDVKRGIWFATGTINSIITGNTINNLGVTVTGAGGAVGVTISSGNTGASPIANNVIEKNTISNFSVLGTGLTMGIYLGGATTGTMISQNNIYKIKNVNTTGYGAEGIGILTTATSSNTNVINNFISDISARGYAGSGYLDNGYGIHVNSGTGINIYNNSVNLTVNQTSAGRPAALNVAAAVVAGAIDLRNNVLATNQTFAPTYAIYSASPNNVFSNIDYNNYYSTSFLGFVGGSNRTTLAELQTGFGSNANSVNVSPEFVSANDLHIVPSLASNTWNDKGTPLAAVSVDFDGQIRSATTPDIGADEFALFVSMGTSENTKMNVSTYPNPTTDMVNFKSGKQITKVEIYDVTGKKMGEQNFKNAANTSVSLGKLPAGLYLLKVQVGQETEVVKIMKK